MDTSFISTMASAIDTLSNGFSSFTGSTITGGIWEGNAADNAKNQVTSKIDPKVEAIKEKLKNLSSAIDEGNAAITAKDNIAKAEKAIAEVDASNLTPNEKQTEKNSLEADKKKFEQEFKDHVDKVNSLCSK